MQLLKFALSAVLMGSLFSITACSKKDAESSSNNEITATTPVSGEASTLTERNAQQARLAEQRSQYQQQAAALAQSRQAVAKNALNQSIQMLTASNNASNNYTVQIYGQKYNAANRNYAQPSTVTGNGLYGSNSLSTNANAKSTASNLLPKNIIIFIT